MGEMGAARRPWWRTLAAIVAMALLMAGCGAAPFAPRTPQTSLPMVKGPAVKLTAYPSSLGLRAIDFVGTQDGWVSGLRRTAGVSEPHAVLLTTADGGRHWTSRSAPEALLAMDFIRTGRGGANAGSATTGWALAEPAQCVAASSCASASILRTSDAGGTWQVQWTGVAGHTAIPGRLQIESRTTGYGLLGGQVLATANGGARWRRLAVPGGWPALAMDWVSPATGWVVGGARSCPTPAGGGCGVSISFTADGGRTWVRQLTLKLQGPARQAFVSFATPQDGWLAVQAQGGEGALYRTTDGGRLWAQESSRFLPGRLGPTSLAFVTPQVGWLGVGSGAAPFALGVERTQNAGRSWTAHGHWSVSAVFPLSATDAWAIGSRLAAGPSFLIQTTDGGSHWRQAPINLRPTAGVDFLNRTVGFGIGSPAHRGAILTTTTAGTSWRPVATLAGQRLLAVSFVDPRRGWVLALPEPTAGTGASPPLELWRTSDGGRRWARVSTIRHPYLGHASFLHFASPTDGRLVVGGFPTAPVLRTTDGGRTWHTVGRLQVPPASWSGFTFLDTRTAWRAQSVVASQQLGHRAHMGLRLWLTTDGGATWRAVVDAPATYQAQFGVSFASAADGWMLLRDQRTRRGPATHLLLHTINGGRTWRGSAWPAAAHPTPLAGSDQVPMDFVSAQDGWILAAQGLYRTTDGGASWAWVS